MSDEDSPVPDALDILLRANRSAPGFRDTVRRSLGDFEEWEDQGSVYFSSARAGMEVLTTDTGQVSAIFLFGPGAETSGYQGPIPSDLRFTLSRDAVRRLLGSPQHTGEAQVHLGQVLTPWDKYRRRSYWLHVQYVLDTSRINQITLIA